MMFAVPGSIPELLMSATIPSVLPICFNPAFKCLFIVFSSNSEIVADNDPEDNGW